MSSATSTFVLEGQTDDPGWLSGTIRRSDASDKPEKTHTSEVAARKLVDELTDQAINLYFQSVSGNTDNVTREILSGTRVNLNRVWAQLKKTVDIDTTSEMVEKHLKEKAIDSWTMLVSVKDTEGAVKATGPEGQGGSIFAHITWKFSTGGEALESQDWKVQISIKRDGEADVEELR